MADKGRVIIIVTDDSGGGGIRVPGGGTGGAYAPSPVTVTIKNDRTNLEINADLPNYAAMCINVGDTVRYETLSIPGSPATAVYVERIPAGEILTINPDGNSGTIKERVSGKTVNFYQAKLTALHIKVGDSVKYTLLPTGGGGEVAVNVIEVD